MLADTLIDPTIKFDKLGDTLDDPGWHWRLIGKLIYLTITRSDMNNFA